MLALPVIQPSSNKLVAFLCSGFKDNVANLITPIVVKHIKSLVDERSKTNPVPSQCKSR